MSLLPFLDKAIDLIFPDAETRAKAKMQAVQLEHEGKFKALEAYVRVDEAQSRINEINAKSDSRFQSWWRPACAWICVLGLAYPIVTSLLSWSIQLAVWAGWIQPDITTTFPVPPDIGAETLVPILLGMLGLGGLRSWERNQRNTEWDK